MCVSSKTINNHPLFMVQLDAYKGTRPPHSSTAATVSLVIAFLVVSELIGRVILYENRDFHELFGVQVNRYILARHLGVDALSCFICSILGWWNRTQGMGMVKATLGGAKDAMPQLAYESRLFAYNPGSFRLGLFFFAYQIKNLYDTIVWNDGPEYIFHHVLSMMVAYGSIYPGLAPYYASFFLGISEVSTAVLCILANFDENFGVKGLGTAFPVAKVAVAAVFVTLFILCRCIMWPVASYYFVRDSLWALNSNSPHLKRRKYWVIATMTSLCGLSILQILWLGQIFIQGHQELTEMGFI